MGKGFYLQSVLRGGSAGEVVKGEVGVEFKGSYNNRLDIPLTFLELPAGETFVMGEKLMGNLCK
jgi:hypothetical protein